MNMKNLKYVLVASLMAITGCYSLETAPTNQLSENTFYKTDTHVKQAAMGVYNTLRNVYAFHCNYFFDAFTDLTYAVTPSVAVVQGTYDQTDGVVAAFYQYGYDVVQKANAVIRNLNATTSTQISESAKNTVIGEMKFIRAMGYFRLVTLYGGVPYYDETTDLNKEFNKLSNPRESADFIYGKILEDLGDAIAVLPEQWTGGDYGRASKGAALTLRGKVHLYMKNWSAAISDLSELVVNKDKYGYDLDPDYASLFKLYNGAKSKETIFAIQNNTMIGSNMADYIGNKSVMRLISCNNIVPSNKLVDMYETADGHSFDWNDYYPGFNDMTKAQRMDILGVKAEVYTEPNDQNRQRTRIVDPLNANLDQIRTIYKDRDPRLMATAITPYAQVTCQFAPEGSVGAYYGTDSGSVPQWHDFYICNTDKGSDAPIERCALLRNSESSWEYTYFCRKYVLEGTLGGFCQAYNVCPYTYQVFRYADVLLMLAEAYNENGQLDKAAIELNKVRARVGLPGVNEAGKDWMKASSKDEMTQRIRHERAVEFPLEGSRFFDLIRWGIAEETMNNLEAKNLLNVTLYTHKWQSRNNLWPIPHTEFERNPSLKGNQNPGWDE